MSTQSWSVSLVGVGGLGGAIAHGLVRAGVPASKIVLCDRDKARLDSAAAGQKMTRVEKPADAAETDVVVLCVKPQDVPAALEQVETRLRADAVVISVAAGLTLAQLRGWLGIKGQLVRAMPNVNVAVGSSTTALLSEPGETKAIERAQWLFNLVGTTTILPDEKLMDAATALGASGPAFVALMLEALMDGGVKAGLPRALAVEMALGMMRGTAQHLQERNLQPGALKDMVMSPAGTTAAGMAVLEEKAVRGAVLAAVAAAAARSAQLRDPGSKA